MQASTSPRSDRDTTILPRRDSRPLSQNFPANASPTRSPRRRRKRLSAEGSLLDKLGIRTRRTEAANPGTGSLPREQDGRGIPSNERRHDIHSNREAHAHDVAGSSGPSSDPHRPLSQHQHQHQHLCQSRIHTISPSPPLPSDPSSHPRPNRFRVWWRDLPFTDPSPQSLGPHHHSDSPLPRTSVSSTPSAAAPPRPDAVTSPPSPPALPEQPSVPRRFLSPGPAPRRRGHERDPRSSGRVKEESERRAWTDQEGESEICTEEEKEEQLVLTDDRGEVKAKEPAEMSDNSLSASPSSPASSSARSRDGSLRDRKGKSRRSLVRKAGEASLRASGEFSRVRGNGNSRGGTGAFGEEHGAAGAADVNEGAIRGQQRMDFGRLDGADVHGGTERREEEEAGQQPQPYHAEEMQDTDFFAGGEGGDGLSFDESEMRLQLGDVESSFLPDLTAVVAPVGKGEAEGKDDTYLELADPGRTPGVRRGGKAEEIEDDEGDGLEDLGESPTVAAAERIHIRGVRGEGSPSRKASSKNSTIQSASTLRPEEAPPPQSLQGSLLSADSVPPMSTGRQGSRRNGLTNRQASYQSVDSSLTMGSDVSSSDGTMNADIALQTRGAISTNATMRTSKRRNLLQRLPSLGSVSSHMTGDDARDLSAPSLLASRLRNSANGGDDGERPETPRANKSNFRAPTDTVVAQHVQSIQVPDTIARDFMARNQALSPDKRPMSAGGLLAALQDRPKKTLTLKEQNNKIDKLTKENFDLKLKIHFLDQALQSRSDDGIKDLIEKNVQFQTDLANERKEAQSLRRKIKDLERRLKEQEQGLAEARSRGFARDGGDEDSTLQGEMHEEILYLRQQLDRSENQVTTLTEEVMTKELEKRKMAEHMRNMAGKRGDDSTDVKETMDMWQGLLNAETSRREHAEEELGRLRDELNALRIQHANPPSRRPDLSRGLNGSLVGANSALVEQLKHENSELRRDLGAQTSMLTSRNRERERLQQEIEDLKLMFRKGDSVRSGAGESLLDRSVSRAHHRSGSRASAHTDITEAERDDWEKKEGLLRDQNAELRIKYQELERTHNTHLQYVAVLEGDYRQMETDLGETQEDLYKMQGERDEALHACVQQETDYEQLREEALAEISALDDEKKILEAQLEDAISKGHRLQAKLQNASDEYKGVQGELRGITQSVINLEDEKQANVRTIQTLEHQISEAEDEIHKWERKCAELDEKTRKLEVTQESLHSEITFLREEQEGDKIRIGELEDALNAARQNVQDELERMREMEESILEERQQRDVLENQSKEEVQKVLDDLNAENTRTKDEVRKLRRSLSAREVEVSAWKQKLEELEQNLRHALGTPDGTKLSLLADIEKLQRDVENTTSELDRARMDLADKDRLLRHRDGLLESTSLESRRLSDLLDKERASRKHDLDQFDKASRGQATQMRTIAQQESRLLELETTYGQDKRKMAALEQQYREQLRERNNLLLALWNRLSTLCGVQWAQNHSLVNGENPSVEVIAKHLSGFSSNIISAIKTIETLIGNFKSRIRGIEKDLARDFQTLEHNLEVRVRRIDDIERMAKEAQKLLEENATSTSASATSAAASSSLPKKSVLTRGLSNPKASKNTEEISRLKSEVKVLRSELKAAHQREQQASSQPSSSSNPSDISATIKSPRRTPTSPARAIASLLRHSSSSSTRDRNHHDRRASSSSSSHTAGIGGGEEAATAAAQQTTQQAVQQVGAADHHHHQQQQQQSGSGISASSSSDNDNRWRMRLAELERMLQRERDSRRLDREGAKTRLLEGKQENRELREALEREREKGRGKSGEGVKEGG